MSFNKRVKSNDWHSVRKRNNSVDGGVYDPSAEREAFRELQIYRSLKQAYYSQQIVMRDTKYPFPVLQRNLQTHGPSSMRGRKQLFLQAWEAKADLQNDSKSDFIKKMNVRSVSVYSGVVMSAYYEGETVEETFLEYSENV
jgi:hypothetical protein